MSRPHRRLLSAFAGVSTLALTAAGLALTTPSSAATAPQATGAGCLQAAAHSGPAAQSRQRAFEAAAATYDVPAAVLLGISFMESRWDDHAGGRSTSGGYGPMHLTDVTVEDMSRAKGDGTVRASDGPASLHTVDLAARLTGLDKGGLTQDDAANICGGAAVLASYQRQLGQPLGEHTGIDNWADAVTAYAGGAESADTRQFVRQVFSTIRDGKSRVTNDGQSVTLAAHPTMSVAKVAPAPATTSTADAAHIDCPQRLHCEWIPAPYEWYGAPDPTLYGNHDLANRPRDMDLDYIVIHDTETLYDPTIDLVTDPTYVSWNYTIRSSDGHVAQHLDAHDVGWHAGNWYVNMHSIGIEHEGFAATGATWFTERLYRSSATLVRYLAREYDVHLDRAHIIGHDQVPGTIPSTVKGMHWDPGPYWNWEHYMRLLGAPIAHHGHARHDGIRPGRLVTVAPGFHGNQQLVTGCTTPPTTNPCPPQGTNFVYLHTEPDAASPLVTDVGLHEDGSPSTTQVDDIGARVAAGHRLMVADRVGPWLGVWYLGDIGWLYSPRHDPAVVPAWGRTVEAAPGLESVPVYGRAYPEASAYPPEIPYETVTPLQYSIKAGQAYALADRHIETDFYYAKTFNCAYLPLDCTEVEGQDTYYEIWFGHRMAYVRAADVVVQ